MLDELTSRKFCHLLAECEQLLGTELTSNPPMSIGLNLYIAERSGERRSVGELREIVAVPRSTFDRYVHLMEARGLIETSFMKGSLIQSIELTEKAKTRFGAIFFDDLV